MTVASEESVRSKSVSPVEGEVADFAVASIDVERPSGLSFKLPFWLRLSLSLSVLAYLIWRTNIGQVGSILGGLLPLGLALAVGVQLAGKFVWSLRWSALLRAYDIKIPIWTLVRAIFIGQFFNNFLPTSVGGDLYRGYWILDKKQSYQRSMFIIFLERFIGVVTMGYIALPALALLLLSSGQTLSGQLLAIAVLLAILCGGVLALQPRVFHLGEAILGLLSIEWFEAQRSKIGRSIEALHAAGNQRWWIVVTSIGVQLVGIGFYYSLGIAIGLELAPWHYLVIVPLVNVATMLPISINGMGVREGSLILITQALGVNVTLDQALVLGLLASIMIPAVSLFGGWFYVRGRDGDVRRN